MTMKGSDDVLLLVEMVMNDKLSRTATETNHTKRIDSSYLLSVVHDL